MSHIFSGKQLKADIDNLTPKTTREIFQLKYSAQATSQWYDFTGTSIEPICNKAYIATGDISYPYAQSDNPNTATKDNTCVCPLNYQICDSQCVKA